MNNLSNKAELRDEPLECDLVILGMMAVQYGKGDSKCPVRGFGDSVENRSTYVPETGLWYAVNTTRVDGVNGVLLTVRESQGGAALRNVWFPFDSFRNVKVTMKGRDI